MSILPLGKGNEGLLPNVNALLGSLCIGSDDAGKMVLTGDPARPSTLQLEAMFKSWMSYINLKPHYWSQADGQKV